MQSQVNLDQLTALYNSDPKAKALFDHYAERQRGRQDSTAPRTRRVLKDLGIDMTSKELSDFYRKMQEAGIGRCVVGRRGKVSRFMWGFHLRSVAEAAQGKPSVLRAAPKTKAVLPRLSHPKAAQPALTVAPVAVRTQVSPVPSLGKIVVRKAGFEIELPLHMSEEDIKDAATFLNSIGRVG